MSIKKKFYITTTLPYVNAEPHIGFALEIVQADVIARYHALQGEDVFFNFGTDEHGQKIYEAAKKEGTDVQKYCDLYAAKFNDLKEALNLSYNNFIRTTDKHHIEAAQEFWKKCAETGDIYKKNYKIKYCVGCELEKTDSELVDGKCLLHPNKDLEIIEEENYFFKFSKYKEKLLALYKNSEFVVPVERFNEIKKFIENDPQDFSISRLKSKMPWGVPVPGDDEHIMYVWFDALVNYISAVGWPNDLAKFTSWWPAVQIAGKDNLRQQSAMWQAMLMSAGLEPSKQIIIHGYVTNEGKKMSKSLGNTVNPIDLAKQYGTDAVRYYLLRHFNPFEDSDFTLETFKEVYNADLANGLGNLVSRVTNLIESNFDGKIEIGNEREFNLNKVSGSIENYQFKVALQIINQASSLLDAYIDSEKPWELVKKDKDKAKRILSRLADRILIIAEKLKPFLPQTAEAIEKQFTAEKIKKEAPLFPRL